MGWESELGSMWADQDQGLRAGRKEYQTNINAWLPQWGVSLLSAVCWPEHTHLLGADLLTGTTGSPSGLRCHSAPLRISCYLKKRRHIFLLFPCGLLCEITAKFVLFRAGFPGRIFKPFPVLDLTPRLEGVGLLTYRLRLCPQLHNSIFLGTQEQKMSKALSVFLSPDPTHLMSYLLCSFAPM